MDILPFDTLLPGRSAVDWTPPWHFSPWHKFSSVNLFFLKNGSPVEIIPPWRFPTLKIFPNEHFPSLDFFHKGYIFLSICFTSFFGYGSVFSESSCAYVSSSCTVPTLFSPFLIIFPSFSLLSSYLHCTWIPPSFYYVYFCNSSIVSFSFYLSLQFSSFFLVLFSLPSSLLSPRFRSFPPLLPSLSHSSLIFLVLITILPISFIATLPPFSP